MISAYLGADLDKTEAWADAQGIGVHGIDPFLHTLTPMVLLHDTRVTNHGYRYGVATPFHAVARLRRFTRRQLDHERRGERVRGHQHPHR